MKRIAVSDLKVDTYFDAPVYLDEEFVILPPDVPLTRELLNRLKMWSYTEVLTNGVAQDEPLGLGEDPAILATIDESDQEKGAQEAASGLYLQLISFTQEIFKGLTEENHLNTKAVSNRVREAVQMVRDDRDIALTAISVDRHLDNYLITQSTATTVVSLAIGDYLKLPPHRLIELGTAALLHRIGMIRLPSALVLSDQALDAQQQKSVLAYPIVGYRLLKNFSINENTALGILEHQERMDGSGYPRHLAGDAISQYARIIAVAASYAAMTADRPFRKAIDGHGAMMDLLKTNRQRYDERVVMALVYCLSLFPIGSHVLLNNGVRAIVYKANPEDPRLPVVRMITDRDGNRVPDLPLVETSQEKNIMVTRSLTAEEASEL